jgi:hypothetical protein
VRRTACYLTCGCSGVESLHTFTLYIYIYKYISPFTPYFLNTIPKLVARIFSAQLLVFLYFSSSFISSHFLHKYCLLYFRVAMCSNIRPVCSTASLRKHRGHLPTPFHLSNLPHKNVKCVSVPKHKKKKKNCVRE